MEGMRSSGELMVESGGCLAQRPARVQRGARNGDGHAGSQAGSIASTNCIQAPLPGVLRHPQVIQLSGQGAIS